MGLQFCNEMVLASKTVFSSAAPEAPDNAKDDDEEENDAMIVPKLLAKHEDQHNTGEKYGCLLRSFKIEIGTALPPTIRLLPTRTYSGSPIGTTYSVSVFPLYDDHKVGIKIIYLANFSLR